MIRTSRACLVLLVGVLVGALCASAPSGAAPEGSVPVADAVAAVAAAVERDAAGPAGVDPGLRPVLGRAAAAGVAAPVEVVVETSEATVVADAIRRLGGDVTRTEPRYEFVQATVPADVVGGLSTLSGVRLVRAPERLITHAARNEALLPLGISEQHGAGRTGTDQKIAVVDLGFGSLSSEISRGNVPATTTRSFCEAGIGGNTSHGTAVLEVLGTTAPGADLYAVCIDEAEDLPDVNDYLAAQGVKIVSFSVGYPFRGAGDGTTIAETALADAYDAGILWFVAAGNLADGHYGGASDTIFIGRSAGTDRQLGTDDDFDINTHAWNGSDAAEPDIFRDFVVPAGGEVLVVLKWDAFPATHEDYDLFLFDPEEISDPQGQADSDEYLPVRCREQQPDLSFDPSSPRVQCSSAEDQAQFGDDAKLGTDDDPPNRQPLTPFEAVYLVNDFGRDKRFQAVVNKFNGDDGRHLDLYLIGDFREVEYPVPEGSLSIPATETKTVAVGAACYSTFYIEDFSGRGPTIDDRIKPDVVALDGMSSSIFGPASLCGDSGFVGTSAATPVAAGIAALLRQGNEGWTAGQLKNAVRDQAVDAGPAGRDSIYGHGIVQFPFDGGRYVGKNPPQRLYDSRESQGGPGPLGTGRSVALQVRGEAGVPEDATAVVLNVTVIRPESQGYLAVYPDGHPFPGTSNLNFRAGEIVPNLVTATIGDNGRIRFLNQSVGTEIAVDVLGWFVPPAGEGAAVAAATGGGTHVAQNPPRRLLDTRPTSTVGSRSTPLGPDESYAVDVRGVAGVPSDATAVILNVTAVLPTGLDANGSFLTVYPDGTSRPTASNLNFFRGDIVPNLVVATVGDNGKVRFYNKNGQVDVLADVLGSYVPGGSGDTVGTNPPKRLLDTRNGTGAPAGRIGTNEALQLPVHGAAGVPPEATAVLLNVTVVNSTEASFLTVSPSGRSRPNTSNLNFAADDLVSNAVVATIGDNGAVDVFNKNGETHAVIDVMGYVIPS